jgi:ubiquitin C-terminal hydrolase
MDITKWIAIFFFFFLNLLVEHTTKQHTHSNLDGREPEEETMRKSLGVDLGNTREWRVRI